MPGPETRVVELRVPGVTGTTGESLLDAVSTVEVAGDGVGRLIRPSDRLRRPAPGPVLQALGRSVPRTLEGYLWGAMTSGGAAKATWALLFPFSLSNVAHWMLPPVPDGSRTAAALGAVCRSLLRVAGLLLTMLLIGQLAVIALDLFATQCLAPGSTCLPVVPDWLRARSVLRTVAGLVPLALVIFVLYRVSGTKWTVAAEDVSPRRGRLPGDLLRAGTSDLRPLHAVGALGTVALLALGGPFRAPHTMAELIVWICALALVVATLLTAAVGVRSLHRWARRSVLGFAALVLAAVIPFRPTLPAGSDATVQALGAALLVVSVLFAVLLVPAALMARRLWRDQPKRLRPWLGGWAAAPVLALAVLLGGGFGAGLAIALRRLAGASELKLPASYTPVTVLWGGGLVLAGLLSLLGFAVAVPLRRRRRGIPEVVRLLQDNPGDEKAAAAAWARSAWERRHLHQLVSGVVFGMSAGAAALLVAHYGFRLRPGWFDPLSALGVFALGAMAVGLLRVVYTAATKPGRNRHLGALADLVCFWPRVAHPAVPPCYALKVVPELAGRAKEHLAEPSTRVVLGGHNVGSVLALIATARLMHDLPERDRERVGLLTAGSPLQWGYQRAFPAVLPQQSLTALYGELGGRWRGLARGTDIFGDGVASWRQKVVDGKLLGLGFLPTGEIGALGPAMAGPTGALVLGGDHWLPDPIRNTPGTRRWAAGVLGHSDYEVDPEWDRAVAMAAGLEFPDGPSTRPFGEQVPLFPDLPRFNLNVAR
ncbi:hypothetical protein [Amycolatopsis alkalitolerans]|uniref:Integral membrane protein n=1 Tax=Amycolatopsis alkalitolerans TaxID=2547244 RepID=A0A5C4LU98_9PSEU|nr:hypothetical protein [Amycolatopsis alkalitolerans]TNC21321.1 hypothetical protein FG385_28510 [Amycolatopsis alkalitolerans]